MYETGYIVLAASLIAALIIWKIVRRIIRAVRDNKLMQSVTDKSRGTRAERQLVVSLLKNGIPAKDIYHDLYLEYRPGYYSQIDVVAIVPAGIIVFEEKDYSGWIFGKGWQKQWTQVMNYGQEKNRFYNPVKQNETHIVRIKAALGAAGLDVRFLPVIIFHGNCELRDVSEIPTGTFVGYAEQLSKFLKEIEKLPACNFAQEETIRRTLRAAVRNGKDPSVIERHLANVNRWRDNQ